MKVITTPETIVEGSLQAAARAATGNQTGKGRAGGKCFCTIALLESIVLQTTALNQIGRPAADVSALIVAHGHEIISSHAVVLGVWKAPLQAVGWGTTAGESKYFCTN